MKKALLSVCTLLIGIVLMSSVPEVAGLPQKRTIYAGIAFYNLENLFDTLHDEGKNDYDFLPDGSFHWNGMKYRRKLEKLSRVLSELCTERVKGGAAFIGVSEVENESVLRDLVAQPSLAEKGYKYLHIEGDDVRGVDVSCLYNPKMFKPRKSELISTTEAYKKFSDGHITRGIFHVEGSLLGEPFHFLVNHWPSRAAASEYREFIARIVRQVVDSIQNVEPDARIVIMGDLNDDPDNKSVTEALGAKLSKKKIQHPGDLYDPWNDMLRKRGQGTLLYDNMWNLFDQIIFTANLLGDDRSSFKFFKNEIYMPEYMTTVEGRFTGAPRRTHSSGIWQDGYSDHFPTQIYLVKEM
ncbi:MAG: endonuclease/exonuclease/phosphatase family protein [Bacteroidaceae bacterium]|nr:endonuclease/exonuclease/phosphatase family protein [Bacteroidaceae bacterium]